MYHLTLSNLSCEACEKLVIKKISKLYGNLHIEAGEPQGKFVIHTDEEINEAMITKALTGTDYQLISLVRG